MQSASPTPMNYLVKLVLGLVFAVLFCHSAHAQTMQGRLTLVSNQPVMISDKTNATSVYYTPYVGNILQGYNGTNLGNETFTQMTLSLDSTVQTSGNIYDLFTFQITGTWYLCTGPAWSSISSSPWRGTGAGSTAITQVQGIWVNANAISNCYYNSTGNSISIPADEGVYVGSVYMTGNGETSMQFTPTSATGGTSNILGLYNAYNRVRNISRNIDSANPAWTDSTASWQLLDVGNSTSTNTNTISYLDGLAQSSVDAQAAVNIVTSSSSVVGYIGVSLDNTTPTEPGGFIGLSSQTGLTYGVPVLTFDHFQPQYGFHYVAAVQYATGATVTYKNAVGGTEELKVELEM
jgi:hypothetical protein